MIIPMLRPIITNATCNRAFTSNERKLLGRSLPPKAEGWVDPSTKKTKNACHVPQ
jgi:hypothetical protein